MAKRKVVVHETKDPHGDHTQHFANQIEIAKKAFEIYESRGCVPGRDLDDWLAAEKAVLAEKSSGQ